MEDKDIFADTAVVQPGPPSTREPHIHPKKKRSSVNPLRVALLLVRRRSSGNKEPMHAEAVKPGERGVWKTLVAAVRPLHHHQQPRQLQHTNSAPALHATTRPGDSQESFHDVLSSTSPSTSEAFSSDGMSRYASADDLRALDTGGRDDEADGGDGPHEIDLMAEEFIAKFYEQMRLQQSESTNCKA